MSDDQLREAERRWHETGDAADEARFLTERVRAGDLTATRLELAALCGHQGAGIATGLPALVSSARAASLQDDVWQLGRLGSAMAALTIAGVLDKSQETAEVLARALEVGRMAVVNWSPETCRLADGIADELQASVTPSPLALSLASVVGSREERAAVDLAFLIHTSCEEIGYETTATTIAQGVAAIALGGKLS